MAHIKIIPDMPDNNSEKEVVERADIKPPFLI